MNPNNINERVERIYQSLSSLKNEDLSNIEIHTATSNNSKYIKVDFNNGRTEADLRNSIFSLIGNIALLKDHLNVWCKRNGIEFDVENIIDSNKYSVAIIHDLNNIEKHLELNRPPRSGFLPKIINLQQDLNILPGMEVGGYASYSLDPNTGEFKTETGGGGKVELVISGGVVNEKEEPLGDLMEICQKAINIWEIEFSKLSLNQE